MKILELFINFAEKILTIEILDYSLLKWLISILITIIVFKLIGIMANRKEE